MSNDDIPRVPILEHRSGPITRSYARSQPASPTKSSRSGAGSAAGFLPRVAQIATGSDRQRSFAGGRRQIRNRQEPQVPAEVQPPEPRPITLSDEDARRLRAIIIEEITPICTRIVIQEINSKLPDLELAAQLEATRIADSAKELVSDQLDERIAQLQEDQVLSTDTVQRMIATSLQEERRLNSRRIEELEKMVLTTRSAFQREVDDLRNDAKATGQRDVPPVINKGKTPSTRRRDKESDKSERSRRKSSKRHRRDSRSSKDSHSEKSNNRSQTESDGSTSSDGGVREVRSRRNLAELNPSNSRFKRVLSYKTYRLQNRDQREGSQVCKRVASWTKRMGTSIPTKFNGSDPISVLKFLAQFKKAADQNSISEGGARLVLPSFLAGKAALAYGASLQADAVNTDNGGNSTYCDAVQWLLRTYAKDRFIHQAVQGIREIRQKVGETEMEYGDRLIVAYSRFGGVYTQEEQINQYLENLSDTVSYDVTRERQRDASEYFDLQSVIELADSFGQALRARQGKTRVTPRRVLTVQQQGGQPSTTNSSYTAPLAQDQDAVLALDYGDDIHAVDPPTTPSYTTWPSEYNSVPDVEYRDPYPSTPDSRSSQERAAALPMMDNMNPRLERHAQPYRPGWKQSIPQRQATDANQPREKRSLPPGHACYLCAGTDHYLPDCPTISDAARNSLRQTLANSSPEQRKNLPRFTYQIARLSVPDTHPSSKAPRATSGNPPKILTREQDPNMEKQSPGNGQGS